MTDAPEKLGRAMDPSYPFGIIGAAPSQNTMDFVLKQMVMSVQAA